LPTVASSASGNVCGYAKIGPMRVVAYDRAPPGEIVDGCVAVYGAAFSRPPYHESPDDAAALRDRVERYAARDGFRLPVAAAADGTFAGFALGVIAHPGDWWRDKVATAIGPQAAHRWLGQACLEVVLVAVDPAYQRRGIGRQVLRELLRGTDVGTAVLSCHPAAEAAQQFYLSEGWQTLTKQFRTQPAQLAYWVMGYQLSRS
jgi:ribosomal protein S18 acetylase RimI-like enzyme